METWKDIEGYEGHYKVSSWGRVANLRRPGHIGEIMILSPRYDQNGYAKVGLWNKNNVKECKVHRLVALAFLGYPPKGKETVNHKDGRHHNNFVWNLEWASQLENNLHSIHVLRNRYVPIARYDKEMKLLEEYESVTAASKDIGAEKTNIVKACRAFPNKTCAGYIWKYIGKKHGKGKKNVKRS